MQLAARVNRIAISPTSAVLAAAEKLRAQGADLADFGPGEPDFPTPEHIQRAAIRALEHGGVVVLPQLAFELAPEEQRFLSPRWSSPRAKNISLEAGVLKGAQGDSIDLERMTRMVERFAARSRDLVAGLFPRYAPYVKRARTSFRPQPATGRALSWRKDDSRLHIDAFPTRPSGGWKSGPQSATPPPSVSTCSTPMGRQTPISVGCRSVARRMRATASGGTPAC